MRKSREILEYRWQEMTVIASDTYEDVVIADGNSADEDAESAETSDDARSSKR